MLYFEIVQIVNELTQQLNSLFEQWNDVIPWTKRRKKKMLSLKVTLRRHLITSVGRRSHR